MATLDLSLNPYERLVNTSKQRPYHEYMFCICKDELLDCLSKIVTIELFNKYNCYISGKINTSSSYPTWDCDMIITSSIDEDLDEILNIFKQIKTIGFEKNMNFDLKYVKDIEIFNKAVETPDDPIIMKDKSLGYDTSNNEFVLFDTSKNIPIRKTIHKEWTYYKPLLVKKENSNVFEQAAIDFINNSNLPNSSERNNEFAIRRHFIFNEETQKREKVYL